MRGGEYLGRRNNRLIIFGNYFGDYKVHKKVTALRHRAVTALQLNWADRCSVNSISIFIIAHILEKSTQTKIIIAITERMCYNIHTELSEH